MKYRGTCKIKFTRPWLGSTDNAVNFACGPNPVDAGGVDTVEVVNARQNERIFGKPYIPSAPCPGCTPPPQL
jgi:hypothetical protein